MKNNLLRVCVAWVCLAFSYIAPAALIINFNEVGADVLATYSGSFASLPGISGFASRTSNNQVASGVPAILLSGAPGNHVDFWMYDFISNFPTFGSGNSLVGAPVAGTYSGATSFLVDLNKLYLPDTYSLGSSIAGSATWSGQTFASMLLTTGSYAGTLTNGETVTVNVGPAGVPEPGQVAASLLLLAGVGGYVFMKRRKAAKMAPPVAA
jgi:hypothetical protein